MNGIYMIRVQSELSVGDGRYVVAAPTSESAQRLALDEYGCTRGRIVLCKEVGRSEVSDGIMSWYR